MRWVWQHPDWPEFTWDRSVLAPFEERFLHESGRMIGTRRHLSREDRTELLASWLVCEALETSAIEGEFLDRESVRSSIRRRLGLAAGRKPASKAEEGIAEMMVALCREYDRPLDHEMLWRWHRMLMRGRDYLEVIGGYRRHSEAMQVVSGPDYRTKVHYEAPHSERMPEEMERFVEWYGRAASAGSRLPSLTWAGAAHLYFVRIHPFEDGNGRIARALAEKALAQALGEPSLIPLSRTVARRRRAYYDILEKSSVSLDISPWLAWFADAVLDAQLWSERRLVRSVQQTQLFDSLRTQLNPRQEKVLLRLFRAEPDGFEGGLSARNYRSITGASASTATRDLADMVAMGALRRTGELRHTRYWLNLPPFNPSLTS